MLGRTLPVGPLPFLRPFRDAVTTDVAVVGEARSLRATDPVVAVNREFPKTGAADAEERYSHISTWSTRFPWYCLGQTTRP